MRLFASLQSTFVVLFTLVAALPLLAFGFFADIYLRELYLAQIERELSLHAQEIRGEVDALLGELRSDLTFIGRECSRLLDADPRSIDRFLQNATDGKPYYLSLYFIDEKQRIHSLGLPGRLIDNKEDYRGLDLSRHILLTDAAGRNDPAPRLHWSEVFVSVTSGEPSISLSVPQEQGSLLGTIDLRSFTRRLDMRIPSDSLIRFAIVDRHGTVLAHSNPETVMQRTNLLALHPEILEALTSRKEVGSKLHEDHSMLESVRIVREPGWVVHVTLPREAALQPLQQVRGMLLLTISAAILISLALAVWLAHLIARPLLQLRDTAGALARGDYARVDTMKPERFAEVEALTASIRQMSATVRMRETTLRESETRFRSLVEGMAEGLMIVDRDGMVVEANPAAEQTLGRPRRELIGAGPVFSWWTPIREDGTRFAKGDHPARQSLESGREVSNQLMGLQHLDGREIWIQINSRPLYVSADEVDQVLLTFSDVTGLKVAEEALRLSKLRFQELYQQFSALLEGITDRISLLAPDLRVVWANQHPVAGCIDLEGQAPGSCCYQQSFARTDPCEGCPAMRSFASGDPAEGELVDPLGRSWFLRAFPVIARGAVQNVVLIAEDVTEKRAGERQRARANQLAALGELAAGVAHEINNPISGVINYAQLLLNRAEAGSREHDIAGRIIKEGDRIAGIVRELLTFAREESAETTIVSIREALADALALCETPLRKEGIDLRIDLPSDLPRVTSRGHQLQQLFLNLISNARHALTEKYPESHPDKILEIQGRPVDVGGTPGLRLIIRDRGTGIPGEMLERVLIPFVTTKAAGVGTGLGLSVCFDIVKKHGGTLALASEYGAWTEVAIDLPGHSFAPGDAPAGK